MSSRKRPPTFRRLFATPQSAKRQRVAVSRINRIVNIAGSRRAKGRSTLTVRHAPGTALIAPRFITTNTFVFQGTSSAGVVASDSVFSLNNVLSPAGAGRSVQGFSQLSSMYNRYRVWSVAYELRYGHGASASGDPLIFCCVPNNTNSAFGGTLLAFEQACESPYAKIGPACQVGGPGGTIRGRIQLWKLNGVTRREYGGSDRFQSLVNTSPSEQLCLHVVGDVLGPGTFFSTSPFVFQLKLWFKTEWFDPIQQPV